jgi:hypothetical protein
MNGSLPVLLVLLLLRLGLYSRGQSICSGEMDNKIGGTAPALDLEGDLEVGFQNEEFLIAFGVQAESLRRAF